MQLVSVSFSPVTVKAGEPLTVTFVVKNDSDKTAETDGPDPGFSYTEGDTFTSRGFPDTKVGAIRVGVDLNGGQIYPYRWGLGSPLAPGEQRTITGTIVPTKEKSASYHGGLVAEQVAWIQKNVGATTVTVSGTAPPPTDVWTEVLKYTEMIGADLRRVITYEKKG